MPHLRLRWKALASPKTLALPSWEPQHILKPELIDLMGCHKVVIGTASCSLSTQFAAVTHIALPCNTFPDKSAGGCLLSNTVLAEFFQEHKRDIIQLANFSNWKVQKFLLPKAKRLLLSLSMKMTCLSCHEELIQKMLMNHTGYENRGREYWQWKNLSGDGDGENTELRGGNG